MTYTIDPAGDLLCELQVIARDQLAKAIDDLERGHDLVESVHDCRKRCKKLRGLVRLVRPALGDQYASANTTLRDAARHLSPLRDAHALHATFVEVIDAQRDLFDTTSVEPVVDELEDRADEADPDRARDAIAEALELLRDGREAIDGWELADSGWQAIGPGLEKTYRRGRRALDAARRCPTPENLHEYRKRTKYTWYHVRLLEDVAPAITGPLDNALHELSNVLGDDHDLAVLSRWLDADVDAFGGAETVDAARSLIAAHRDPLQRRALELGAQLHAEKPSAFVTRFAAYWHAR